MGTYDHDNVSAAIKGHHQMILLNLQAWPLQGQTYITTSGLYAVDGQQERRPLGAHVHPGALFALPSLHQTGYAVLQESLKAWRELFSPK